MSYWSSTSNESNVSAYCSIYTGCHPSCRYHYLVHGGLKAFTRRHQITKVLLQALLISPSRRIMAGSRIMCLKWMQSNWYLWLVTG